MLDRHSLNRYKQHRLIRRCCFFLSGLAVIVFITVFWLGLFPASDQSRNNKQDQSEPYDAVIARDDPAFLGEDSKFQPQDKTVTYTHVVTYGESLKTLFDLYGLAANDLLDLIKTNATALQLKNGQVVEWQLNTSGKMESLSIYRTSNLVSQYTWHDAQFIYRPVRIKGESKTHIIRGRVTGNFYHSASLLGLTQSQIQTIYQALFWDIDITHQVRLGDKYKVAISQHYVGSQVIGKGQVEAIRYYNNKQEWMLIRNIDGHFYHPNGTSNQKSLSRLPLEHSYRVSSAFNLYRINPVTHIEAPHYGTDFAVPTGSPVLSTGDGKVVRVGEHPLAGLYIVIQNGPIYSSRFLHLSEILVKEGQHISKGEIIALSGNSGRTTGPHLHYELRQNNLPVNPMLVPLPDGMALSTLDLSQFRLKSQALIDRMRDPI